MKYLTIVMIVIFCSSTLLLSQNRSRYEYVEIVKIERLILSDGRHTGKIVGKAHPGEKYQIRNILTDFIEIDFNGRAGFLFYGEKVRKYYRLIASSKQIAPLIKLLNNYNQKYSNTRLINERNDAIQQSTSSTKGEFETQVMYEKRLNNQKFHKLSIINEYNQKIQSDKAIFNKDKKKIKSQIEELISKSKQKTSVNIMIGRYDPEEEKFPVSIDNTNGNKFVYIPIEHAPSFKKRISQMRITGYKILNWSAFWEYSDIIIKDNLNGKVYPITEQISKEKISLNKVITAPPRLVTRVEFIDDSGNQILDAGESAKIKVSLKNSGSGPARNLQVILSGEIDGKNVFQSNSIGTIAPGQSETIELGPIIASDNINTGKSNLKIEFLEDYGFEPNPISIIISTQAAIPPDIKLVDFDIDGASKNGKIERGELTEIKFRIQNIGRGLGKSVNAKILLGENVFLSSFSKLNHYIGNLKSGEYKDIQFSIYTNNRIKSDIPVNVIISEETGKFGYNHKLDLAINKTPHKLNQIVFEGVNDNEITPTLASFSIDVHKNIPLAKRKNNNAFAIVIGNRDYDNKDVPTVDFALRDAQYVKEYLIKTLGYRLENIIYYENATLSNIRTAIRRLSNLVDSGKSDVFVYYSGHGAPDVNTKKGYLVPVDCNPSFVKAGGYPLSDLYSELRDLKAKSTTVVIDACFSGNSAGGALLKNMSPISIEIDNDLHQNDNIVLFNSSGQDQISSWYPEKKHSLFTYYFLKALQGNADKNKDKILTVDEISAYLNVKVPATARKLHNREQYPRLITNNKNISLVNYD